VPVVKTLADRVEKFKGKTAPDRVGSRYGNAKSLAVDRYLDGVSPVTAIREAVRNILESEGVPAGLHVGYYAFALEAARAAFSHSGTTLVNIVAGLKAKYTAFGADPAILDKIAKLFVG
jgi:hypothetical protein